MKKLVFTLGLLVWLTVPVQAQTVPIFWEKLESLEASITAVATGPDGTVFVGTEEGIYRSRDHGLSWEPLRAGLPEYVSTAYVSALHVTPEGRLFAIIGDLYWSQDDGDTWTLFGTGAPDQITDFAISPDGSLFSGSTVALYRTVDEGQTWENISPSETGPFEFIEAAKIAINADGDIFLATYIYGYIYRSQDNGNTWTRLENGLPLNQGLVYNHPVALITSGSEDIFYSTYATDGTALPKTSAGDPSIDTDTGFFSSTDHGETWTKINKSLPCKNPSPCDYGWGPLAVDEMGTPFLAIYDYNSGKAANFYHVFYSLDRGESWIEVGAGVRFFAQGGLTSLGVSPSGYVYVGFTAGLYRSKQPITVSRDESPIEIPQRLLLEQNYPNPFNERTTIAFYVPETGPVRLTLYSLLGKKITTLIDGPLAVGKHRVSVDGMGLAGGIYLYRLETSSVTESKVMMIGK